MEHNLKIDERWLQRIESNEKTAEVRRDAPGEPERWREAFPDDPFIEEVDQVEAEIADRDDIPDHRKKWGWGGMYADPDEIEEFARNAVCSGTCGGVDPLIDRMDPLFGLDGVVL